MGTPIKAIISIIFKVRGEEEALYIVKLYAGLVAITQLGNIPAHNVKIIVAMALELARNTFP
jgi:hypothetical protein